MAFRSWSLSLAAAALVLGGCASGASAPSAAPSLPSPSLPSASAPVSLAPSAAPGAVTISGELLDGVEAGCVLLRTADKTYLLIGGDKSALVPGRQLTVVGEPQPGLMTTCQQGTPFKVTSVR